MEKIAWTEFVRKYEVLRGVGENRDILHTLKRKKANSIGQIFSKNCPLERVTENEGDK
jgi:hypothetical protein